MSEDRRVMWVTWQRPFLLGVAVAGLAGLSLLAAGCGTTQTSSTSTIAAESSQLEAGLALARCMRSHGVPDFPDPKPNGQFPPFHSDSAAAKQASLAAQEACKSVESSAGVAGAPQNRQLKFAFALKVAACLRARGFPTFPDPSASGHGASQSLGGAGIDVNSPQFQTAETGCEARARKALGLA